MDFERQRKVKEFIAQRVGEQVEDLVSSPEHWGFVLRRPVTGISLHMSIVFCPAANTWTVTSVIRQKETPGQSRGVYTISGRADSLEEAWENTLNAMAQMGRALQAF